jgi:ketosteroid isomerase-like protein
MSPQELAGAYLDALSRADVARMLDLFSDDALVHSPLYGPVPASMFFPADPADRLRHR